MKSAIPFYSCNNKFALVYRLLFPILWDRDGYNIKFMQTHKQCSNGTAINALKLISFEFDLTLSECSSCKYPLKTLHGKTEIWFAKSNGLQYSVWEGSENMGFDLRRCNFFGLLNLDILCSCLCYKFYSFMFIHKISIRVVCASDYHPRSHDLSRWWKKDTGYPVATLM